MCKIHQGKNLAKCDSILKATDVREGVKKKTEFIWDFVPKYG